MLYFLSYIIKVVFSVLAGYSIVYWSSPDDEKEEHVMTITLFSLFSSSFLGILYLFQLNTDNIYILSIGLIINSVLMYIIIKELSVVWKFSYLFCFFACIAISIGYIIHSIIILILFYYIKKNILLINLNQNNLDEQKDKIIDNNE